MHLSRLIDALIAWLKMPRITVCLSDDNEKAALLQENDGLRLELERMRSCYAEMADLQLRYADSMEPG